jgi:hypothetical protein
MFFVTSSMLTFKYFIDRQMRMAANGVEKGLLSFFLIICSLSIGLAQGVISQPRQAVLYRNYPNKIEIGQSGLGPVKVVGIHCTITSLGKGSYKVLTGKEKNCSILVLNGNKDTIAQQVYKVLPLPQLTLKWGSVIGGGEVTDRTQRALFLAYPDEVAIVADQTVESFQLTISGKSFSGKGNLISPEAQRYIQDANAGTMVVIAAKYKDGSGNAKEVKSSYRLE